MALKAVTPQKPKREREARTTSKGETKHSGRSAARVKKDFLRFLQSGDTVKEALRKVDRTVDSYEYWRRSDAEFKRFADQIIGKRRNKAVKREVPDFPEFCEKYLGWRLFRHQLQWYDVLEGREPRDVHPSQTLELGRSTHLIVNTPPNHGKSTTITVMYTVWRILRDPSTRVIIISKSHKMAADFLYQIKDILTNETYQKLHIDFGPMNGFEESCPIWRTDRFYFGPDLRKEAMKDPTVQAIGMGGHLYGTRADLIILDDCIEPDNAHEFEKQINWLSRVVLTRPGKNGTVLVVGTRVAPQDLYGELRKPQYSTGKKAWTYFAQPAVEEFADDPADWKTLWPKSNKPQPGDDVEPDSNGEYPAWDGPALSGMRDIISQVDNTAWAQGYQQEQVAETAIFPREDVYGCVNGMRHSGRLVTGIPGHPPGGMAGKYVIAGLDPASAGHTAAVALAVDLASGKRYVLDVHNQMAMTPDQVRLLMLSWTDRYSIQEWRIEKVLLSNWITQDREIQRQLANRGTSMSEHHTGRNKWDVDAGVMSMATLFKGWQDGNNLIELPRTDTENIRQMCEQLVTYFPETKGKTDILMALWFAEIRAREIAQLGVGVHYAESEWLSERDRYSQVVIDLAADDDSQEPIWWS